MSAKLSVSIIGFNEERFLEKCLESVKWADEIIYVDCGSSDGSLGVAERHNARVFRRQNDFNINVNKQFGIDQCSGDWILYLDPDETVQPHLKEELSALINSQTPFSAFYIPRKNFYFCEWLKHGGKYPDAQLRLFRRGKGKFPCVNIHEKLEIEGESGRLKNDMRHEVIENSDWMLDKIKSYALRKSRQSLRLEREPRGFLAKGVRRFFSNYFLKAGFLDGKTGFIVASLDFFNEMVFWLKYRELKNNDGKN